MGLCRDLWGKTLPLHDYQFVLEKGFDLNVLVHVPHSSPRIPTSVRNDLAVDDRTLSREVAAMTDWLTAPLALAAVSELPVTTWINPWSRLVVDPERFPDEREQMTAVGMGAVYLTRHDGGTLRLPDPARDEELIRTYYSPYAQRMSDLVTDNTVIVDLHSFPSMPLPYELAANGERDRPPLCVGTDAFHTPAWLTNLVCETWSNHFDGDIGIDTPFSGTYVPLNRYGTDSNVYSIMIEIRRDILHPSFDDADVLLASGLLPPRPWQDHGPEHQFALPNPTVVSFTASILKQLSVIGTRA